MTTAQTRIWNTIDDLQSELGRMPTHNEVFDQVGGSMSTISKYFKSWRKMRPEMEASISSGMPEFFQSACQRLYDAFDEKTAEELGNAIAANQEKVTAANQLADSRLAETLGLRHELTNAVSDRTTLQSELSEARNKIDDLTKKLDIQTTVAKEAGIVSDQRSETIKLLELGFFNSREDNMALVKAHKTELTELKAEYKTEVTLLTEAKSALLQSMSDKDIELSETKTAFAELNVRWENNNERIDELELSLQKAQARRQEAWDSSDNYEAKFLEAYTFSLERNIKFEQASALVNEKDRQLGILKAQLDDAKAELSKATAKSTPNENGKTR